MELKKNVLKERFDIVRHFSTRFATENLEHKLHFCIFYLNSRLKFRTGRRFFIEISKMAKIRKKFDHLRGKRIENSQR